MSSLLQSVFTPNRRHSEVLSGVQGHELERGGRSSSQLNETPFSSPVQSPTPSFSSSHPSGVGSPLARYQQDEHDIGPGIDSPAISATSTRPGIELMKRDVIHDVSNALEVVPSGKAEHASRPKSEPVPSGAPLPDYETSYATNAASSSLAVPSSPVSSQKRPKRSKKSKHFSGFSFETSLPPSQPTGRERKSLLGRFNPSLVLENSGSVARDHLASERTFLAYVRTSLALTSMGVAIVQLFTIADLAAKGSNVQVSAGSQRVQKFARPLGVTAVILALLVLVIGKLFPLSCRADDVKVDYIGLVRYFIVQHALPEKMFPVARFSVAFVTFVLGSITVVIFAALLSGSSS